MCNNLINHAYVIKPQLKTSDTEAQENILDWQYSMHPGKGRSRFTIVHLHENNTVRINSVFCILPVVNLFCPTLYCHARMTGKRTPEEMETSPVELSQILPCVSSFGWF